MKTQKFNLLIISAIVMGIIIEVALFLTSPHYGDSMGLLKFIARGIVMMGIFLLIGYNPEKFNHFIFKYIVTEKGITKYTRKIEYPKSDEKRIRLFRYVGYGGAVIIGLWLIEMLALLMYALSTGS